MKSLRYDIITAGMKCSITDHPQKVMRDLGITYKKGIPQSIADQWWFLFCENIPNQLPAYLSVIDINPKDHIGNGLSKNDALELQVYYDNSQN